MKNLTYGVTINDLRNAKSIAESKLGISLELRNSAYRGGDYYCSKNDGEEIILQLNFTGPDPDDWQEPEHKNFPIVLYVHGSPQVRVMIEALQRDDHFKLIKRE
jgi:hypothetical protein